MAENYGFNCFYFLFRNASIKPLIPLPVTFTRVQIRFRFTVGRYLGGNEFSSKRRESHTRMELSGDATVASDDDDDDDGARSSVNEVTFAGEIQNETLCRPEEEKTSRRPTNRHQARSPVWNMTHFIGVDMLIC